MIGCYDHCFDVFIKNNGRGWFFLLLLFFWSGRWRFGSNFFPMEYLFETLNESWENSWNESNWHQSKLLSNCYFFWRKKKSISYGCMGTDQLKDKEDHDHGWANPSRAFCHTMKWSNVKIYYSYYYKYKYIYIKREITFICGYYRE